MASIFSRIIAGEIPCYKIAENERFFAFLDINPLQEGHTLVIPKQEQDYLFDYDDETIADIMVFAKQIAKALKASIDCQRVAVAVLGLEVPHAHIHLVPIKTEKDMIFTNPKKQFSPEQMQAIAEKIRQAL
ncbi:MAG: HIT family protein [Bacteroidales bacterium]|jgi:histidine triad (HIT) family protein|nr:HIT family protein [Bacteroidales bacterium]MBO5768470.1 HIT family protein [Bacteroidales bacterium]MBO5818162.1 HIT family protein [Bacteroidales bacterium]MBO5835128.1 HIT family protein [Bacteroidales bacterium]MBO7233036.1 HIT family protein [Bacteroidales bacterium]